jgi:carbamoyl-phosphate synthase large subunit
MKKKNILILSAGRRVELVQSFKAELAQLIPSSKVIAVDLEPNLSSACQMADKFYEAPIASSENYISFLKSICEKESIGLVIPTIDSELLALASNRVFFKSIGVNIVISEIPLVSACRNKNLLTSIFHEMELDSPIIYNKNNLSFPCFMKPYDGSSSIGADTLIDQNMLTKKILNNKKNMFMELIPSSYDEYTIDIYYDKNGILKSFVPRLRIQTRSGEISKGATKKNYVYEYLLNKLPNLKGARGCITLQLFVNLKEKSFKAIEINPRFGGGYPLSYAAGANFPKMLIQEYILEESVNFIDDWEDELLMLRYDSKILIHDYKS